MVIGKNIKSDDASGAFGDVHFDNVPAGNTPPVQDAGFMQQPVQEQAPPPTPTQQAAPAPQQAPQPNPETLPPEDVTKRELHKFMLLMYGALKQMRDVVAMPTDSNIETLVVISVALSVITGFAGLLHIFTFISWQGAVINSTILIALMCYEKGENNALSKKSYSLLSNKP